MSGNHSENFYRYRQAAEVIRRDMPAGAPLVFTNGCFDLFHPGHLAVLKTSRDLARLDRPNGKVVVGLNTDSSIRRLKGPDRPVMDELARVAVLAGCRFVDHVVLFDEDDPLSLIEALEPDVIVKGGDYTIDQVVGGRTRVVALAPTIPGYSTTRIIERIRT